MARSRVKGTAAPILDDYKLVERTLAGDADAFRTIMQRYNRRLYRIARGVLRSDCDAEDAVQEAYVAASSMAPAALLMAASSIVEASALRMACLHFLPRRPLVLFVQVRHVSPVRRVIPRRDGPLAVV
jgi:hypothetical protein